MSEPIRQSFLTRSINISSATHEALSALAEIEQAEGPDQMGEVMLRGVLAEKAKLKWLIERRRSDRETLRVDYRKEIQAHEH